MRRLAIALLFLLTAFILFKLQSDAVKPDLIDPRSSLNRSGVKTPREYFLPPVPSFDKMDPEEFWDYKKTYETPYALVMIFSPLQSGDVKLQPGYYQVKKTPTMLILKREGEIKMTLPIVKASTEGQTPKKKIKTSRVVVDTSSILQPIVVHLEYCDHHGCYQTAPVTPGLVE